MWHVLILWIALSTWILTSEMFSDLIVFELVSCVLSVPLNDDIMMYENKDISICKYFCDNNGFKEMY
jgi:hypothetical protein